MNSTPQNPAESPSQRRHRADDPFIDAPRVLSRRAAIQTAAALAIGSRNSPLLAQNQRRARIAITLDLEMSAEYPQRGITEWNFEKGNLDADTKNYALQAAHVAEEYSARIHFFCVGRVLEQADVNWLKWLAASGHPIGNHTYDHVNLLAKSPAETQFRFQRAPWLVEGASVAEILRRNIELTTTALKQRVGLEPNGFRTPGGFSQGLAGRIDLQEMLQELGFWWVSSKYDGPDLGPPRQQPSEELYRSIAACQEKNQPFVYPSGLVEIPMSPVSDVGAFRTQRWQRAWFLESIRRGVQWVIEHGGVYDFLAHPSCLLVEDPACESIRLICELARAAGDRAEVTTLDKIAAAFKPLSSGSAHIRVPWLSNIGRGSCQ
jgi:peptidoglycan/xylan/chitin deacetylase (PgdA/CDA1 family)